jgi:hypothetical protein
MISLSKSLATGSALVGLLGALAVCQPAFAATRPATGCTPAQLLGNPGFESGTAPWTLSGGAIAGGFTHSGTYAFEVDNTPYFGGNGTAAQTVTLPAGCTNYTLSYWSLGHGATPGSEPPMSTDVQVNGTDLGGSVISTFDVWTQQTVDLKAYAGQTVTVTLGATLQSPIDGYEAGSIHLDDAALNVS